MKKFHLLLLGVTLCLFAACHNDIWNAIDELDGRLTKLEELCKEMNTNITSLQTIVNVLQANDYITGIVEIKKNGEVIGYTITFGKHDPITIYHGQDGKDGADGKDGSTPVIGVAQDTDGVYYWTLKGEWLLDDNGNKLPVSGKDGQNGADGTMPQLKIEEGYWYVSYDNGVTWTQLGKATGEDGQNGDKGDTGDSMFQSVTQDDNYVYFTLANGTVIKIGKTNGDNIQDGAAIQIIDGAIMAEFSVSETKKVYFSMGNLQYSTEGSHKCADGTTQPGTWRFTEKQWYLGSDLEWGDSGYMKNFSTLASDISNTYYDWGVYNAIENGGNIPSVWRTLTKDEWEYLLNKRSNASKLRRHIIVNDHTGGILLLPDNWLKEHKEELDEYPVYMYSASEMFQKITNNGGIYIPCGELTKADNWDYISNRYIWTSSLSRNTSVDQYKYAIYCYFRVRNHSNLLDTTLYITEIYQNLNSIVRLVKDVE